MGYFQLALAAALEDRANTEALYVVYMKLAEIHGNHMPDAELCQLYRDRACGLKRVLAGEGGTAAAEDSMDYTHTEHEQKDKKYSDGHMAHTESLLRRNNTFDSIAEDEKYEDALAPQNCVSHEATDQNSANSIHNDAQRKEDLNHHLPDTDSLCVNGSETDTTTSHSYSESIFESFDTAKEQISDSSSSTETLQTDQNPTDRKDPALDTDPTTPCQIPVNHTSDSIEHMDTRDTDSNVQDEQNTPTKATDANVDPLRKDSSVEGSHPDTDHAEES